MLTSLNSLPGACFEAERPFFVYDLHAIRQNIARLQSILKTQKCERHRLFFSCKANPNSHLLSSMRELVDGFDVSSELELKMLLGMGIEGKSISVSGPGKTDSFLNLATKAGVGAIHVDSLEELEKVRRAPVRVSLRVANESSAGLKLGLDRQELIQALRAVEKNSLRGLHFYLGTESFSIAKLDELVAAGQSLRSEFEDRFAEDFAFYIGPGLPRADHIAGDIRLNHLLDKNTPINFECGRAISGNAGWYVAPVLAVKKKSKRNVVILNGGVQHMNVQLFSRISGDQGMTFAVWRDGEILRSETQSAVVYGSLCTENDVLHPNLQLPQELRRGDWLALGPCGAYNLTASYNQFIGQPMAGEWLFDSGPHSLLKTAKNISPAEFRAYHESFHE